MHFNLRNNSEQRIVNIYNYVATKPIIKLYSYITRDILGMQTGKIIETKLNPCNFY